MHRAEILSTVCVIRENTPEHRKGFKLKVHSATIGLFVTLTCPPPGLCLRLSLEPTFESAFHDNFCETIFFSPPPASKHLWHENDKVEGALCFDFTYQHEISIFLGMTLESWGINTGGSSPALCCAFWRDPTFDWADHSSFFVSIFNFKNVMMEKGHCDVHDNGI